MTPTVHTMRPMLQKLFCYCFLSTPKIVYCFNDCFNLSIQNQNIVIFLDSKLLRVSDCLLCCVFPDASASGDTKSRVTDSSQSPSYRIRTESEQVSLYSPEQSSLHESEGLLLPSCHLLQPSFLQLTSLFSVFLNYNFYLLLFYWYSALFHLAFLFFVHTDKWCFERLFIPDVSISGDPVASG